MQDRSHKFLFLGLTALMSAACFYGSQTGPTLLVGDDARPSIADAVFTLPDDRDVDVPDIAAPPKAEIAAKLAPDGACLEEAGALSSRCLATAKVSLSSP